ncbi:spidroin-2-like isoform X2 [Thrips palmi]|uniref:Spidroin-2-like isoform X2 n=1 Tax=Thrips palmi TaxID=161013 RepID=A0A6P9A9J8_THRPL|nr:spidroin-2-like isoform X2 [Thrips palmi]
MFGRIQAGFKCGAFVLLLSSLALLAATIPTATCTETSLGRSAGRPKRHLHFVVGRKRKPGRHDGGDATVIDAGSNGSTVLVGSLSSGSTASSGVNVGGGGGGTPPGSAGVNIGASGDAASRVGTNGQSPDSGGNAYAAGGYAPGSYPSGSYTPGSYSSGSYDPGNYNPGSYTPGSYAPGSYTPGSYTPGSYTPGSYTPGSYAQGNYAQSEYSAAATDQWAAPLGYANGGVSGGYSGDRTGIGEGAAFPGAVGYAAQGTSTQGGGGFDSSGPTRFSAGMGGPASYIDGRGPDNADSGSLDIAFAECEYDWEQFKRPSPSTNTRKAAVWRWLARSSTKQFSSFRHGW